MPGSCPGVSGVGVLLVKIVPFPHPDLSPPVPGATLSPSCPELGEPALALGSLRPLQAPRAVLLHKGHVVSSGVPQDLLGLSPKPSGGTRLGVGTLGWSMLNQLDSYLQRSPSEGPREAVSPPCDP